jgi:hypothetical protein
LIIYFIFFINLKFSFMKKLYVIFMYFLLASSIHAQTLQGNASIQPPSLPGSTDYQLTPAATMQRGAFWNNATINLTANFTVSAELNFGNQTGSDVYPASHETTTGADGIAFVLQSVGTSALGDLGEGMGFGGINNSFAVEMDTWQNDQFGPNPINRFDPAADHLAFMKNGDVTHNTVANSNANLYTLANLEDGLWHPFIVSWNAGTSTLTVTLDGVSRSFTGNIPMIIGNGGPAANIVTWGFTAATGAAINAHKVRFPAACAPFTVSASLPSLGCSNGNTIFIGYGPQSITAVSTPADPTTTYAWFKSGTPDMQVATGATFTPAGPGIYYVTATRGACTATTKGNAALVTTVIDIRCGRDNQDKVYVCHKENGVHGNGTIGENSHTLCVSVNAVPAHLAHGDCLGSCESHGLRVSSTEAIEENINNTNIVYPNPNQGSVRVKVDGSNASKSEIIIMNARGYIVERKSTSGNTIQSFDLRKYGTGVFLIKIVTGNNSITNKVLVQE